jgi:hypothetical protein
VVLEICVMLLMMNEITLIAEATRVLVYKIFKGSKMKGKAKISAVMITNTNVDGELSIT